MNFKRKLPIPQEIKEMYPITTEMQAIKEKNDKEIAKAFTNSTNIFGRCCFK